MSSRSRLESLAGVSFAPGLGVRPTIPRGRALRVSLGCAVEGWRGAWRTEPHVRVHLAIAAAVVGLGVFAGLSRAEWLWVVSAIGLVLFAELVNTAIEHTVDLAAGLRPDPLARQAKDLSAGCVLLAAALAALIGVLIFGSRLLAA